jgi:hypothetical protein
VGILVAEVAATHPYTAAAPYFGSTTSANQEGHRTASCISRRKIGLSACKQGTSKLNVFYFEAYRNLLGDIFGLNNNNNNNNKEKTCTLIDVAIPADRNVVRKETEKKLKYKSLCVEIRRMWNLKCTIVPVIAGATGIVTRSLRKNLETVPGKHSIDSLQKTATLGTSHITRKVLQCEA